MTLINVNECAKIIRATLKQAFPHTAFSVRLKKYSMGHCIDATWTDGPCAAQVKPILDRFVSKGFDGSTDCGFSCGHRTINGVRVFVDGGHVFAHRSESRRLREIVVDRLAYECGLGPVVLDQRGNVADHNLHVNFQWHPHWLTLTPGHKDYMTVEEFDQADFILASDPREGEYFATLVTRVLGALSLEEQKPLDPAILPQYIDINADASTGRASFEPPQKMFEGHSDFKPEVQ